MIEVFNETNEIHLSGIVGDGWAEDPITMDGVLKALKAFGSQAVTIRINSPGGAADEGISIHNLLKDYAGEVTTVNDSLVASAASVIFLGGSKRLMGDGSRIMIHRAMGMAFGNATEIKKTLAALESYDQSLVEIYAGRYGKDKDDRKKKKMTSQFDQAKANLLQAKMAQFSKHLTSQAD